MLEVNGEDLEDLRTEAEKAKEREFRLEVKKPCLLNGVVKLDNDLVVDYKTKEVSFSGGGLSVPGAGEFSSFLSDLKNVVFDPLCVSTGPPAQTASATTQPSA